MYRRYINRILDVTGAFVLLVALLPFWALIALIIKLDSKGPVLFKQKRLGMNEVPFQIYKFRTMRTDAPSEMPTNQLYQSGRYITRVGVYLRTQFSSRKYELAAAISCLIFLFSSISAVVYIYTNLKEKAWEKD